MKNIGVCITTRKGKRGTSYALQWHDPKSGLRKTETVGRDKRYARLKAAERQRELESGLYRGAKPISYADFCTEHLEQLTGTLAPRTIDEHDLALRQFDEACKPRDLTVIDFVMLERFRKSRLDEGVTPSTVNKGLITLQAVFSRAVQRGYIVANPFTGNRKALMMRVPEKEPRVISRAGFKKLLKACHNDQWRAIVTVAYYAGLRRGEVLALEWRDVDFAANVLHVRNKTHHLTKSRKNRMVPMTHQVAAVLRRLRVQILKGDLVFTNGIGGKIVNNFERTYRAIAKRAKQLDDKGNPRYGLHDLRRSCATELQRSGVSMKTTQRILGHANMATTAKFYASVENEDLKDAMQRRGKQTA